MATRPSQERRDGTRIARRRAFRTSCPPIKPRNLLGQAAVCALYAGIRAVEIGSLMFGGEGHALDVERARPATPRRVYTQSHNDYVFEAILEVFERRDTLRPLAITKEPPTRRHFTAKMREFDR